MATRPIMTAAELAKHEVRQYGRNYAESDDGYSDMEAEEGRGWHAVANWGHDGWDLGTWPYVMIYVRNAGDQGSLFVVGRRFELMQICEGDRTQYAFESQAEREAAMDYLFLWYAAGQDWAPLTYEDRPGLDAGAVDVDPKWRGPCKV
jgi:hypothetical protein